jgi:peptidoglycan/LPS O-acetylase OafA/YrhL
MCAFLAAELSYYLLEKPFLRLRKRFSNVPGDVTPPRESTPLESAGRLAAAASPSS